MFYFFFFFVTQKPANILVMGEGVERGRVKIGESCLMLMFVSGQQGQVSDVSTCMHIL